MPTRGDKSLRRATVGPSTHRLPNYPTRRALVAVSYVFAPGAERTGHNRLTTPKSRLHL